MVAVTDQREEATVQPTTPQAVNGVLPPNWVTHPAGLDYERHCLDAAPGALYDYETGWEHQREILDAVAHHRSPNRVLYVQHESVYTAGRQTQPEDRPFDGTPVVDVDRGGRITWHGPGQLVGYPIIFLQRGVGVVDYVRRVEEAVIRLLAQYGIATGRIPGRTGVWLASDGIRPERKICAIGVRCAHQTTMHGFALNVDPAFDRFDNIVPCGIDDADVTSIRRELGRAPSLSQVADDLTPHLTEMMSFAPYQMSPDVPRTQHAAFHHPTADHPAADHHQPQPNVVKEIRL
ncbi:lipoyl(octanoyl) transferase LipB [Propionibacterium freudenreichii]|uniref:lipoyl(octanoyl) transferase LipB n=1 Tax=Propionibacterium freudenreichii TaxID=1744 RepID=UPI000AEBC338|nr:lipoyl(octanoyl) transferase LipB [Propionibacterium freudenreichii]MCT2980136.1 lipoyl(octanoyl) transferase LipB [Propionibacterium freudenreichii]MDK9331483.1 lipoyl(octanoyl) transferase LipB [Propionibacterium freudenreichii]MDK9342259.1 lipoyl(octanoyl) transferase LipB [Propionibacterium freudenreichii]MDK9592756.1 lipoyl(octanoyl) transferase LipB [Propionibacterium freudenreichii]MDK9644580.1 lipoyl(octanoyl) transferase LipB [Propionibacterium freudenreichii]